MYDIILWGATGFTGRQAARYLHEQYGKQGLIQWAIAGRDKNKLEAIRNKIGAPGLPIFIVSGGDANAAEQIAKSTKVVCSTIAPAALHASEMVAACVRHGTDYCDLSGELHWLRRMIDQHHQQAEITGARIINACGFDSIPSDLGVQLLQQRAYQEFGEYCQEIKNCFAKGKIAVSGGSFESGKGVMLAVANDPALASLISDPHCLNPRDKMDAAPTQEIEKVIFDKDFDQFIMPFPIGGINSRIVRRSHALNDFKYGKNF
ncbi:MAG TPA: saccharopine dehydrogenase NADP-binding domain-containing protein, partial [Pseudomonadales bacterium]|nr:saccharopine dehydrogenase NADP-binding domain-containing protein [Pseudomonadales bacterium]